jgi:circadian clock protein KaiB
MRKMENDKQESSLEHQGKNGQAVEKAKYLLRLYVTGQTPRSVRSVQNLRTFCESHLKGRFNLEVIDVYQQPGLATENQIIAAPTLIKRMPLPLRRLVGDFSDEQRVKLGLGLEPA